MTNRRVQIFAGPCSIDEKNINEIYEISKMEVKSRSGKKQLAITGTRIVGLKSRTELDNSGFGMGMDYDAYKFNLDILLSGGSSKDFKKMPSAMIAKEIAEDTNLSIATEIMNPLLQLPSYENLFKRGQFLPWNPAVVQLGWHIETMAKFAQKNGWNIGIKNGKWIGDHLQDADSDKYAGLTTMEKTWAGLVNYAGKIEHDIVLIHRGVDVPGKGNFRSAPVHQIAKRVKKSTKAKLFFDPSHSFGPKLKDKIPEGVLEALKMKISDSEYLYDGILIEVGTSTTDTDQHISLNELGILVQEIAKFRELHCRVS